ncbi:MAG: cytochrome c oxidase subunit 3, partial [Alphaproteobacteria bacterium]|nr:cytochrome c oxidase subunit 3 [Alphaproteobacteria bacterium]
MSDHHAPQYVDSGLPQPYHLVRPSPWPIVTAFVAGLMMIGAAMAMHDVKLGEWPVGQHTFVLGLLGVLAGMFLWWRDIVHESVVEKVHNKITETGLRYGMALFIASEVMFFSAFFWAYWDTALFPKDAIGNIWPPANIQTFDPFDVPFIMTIILLLSGTTVTWAHHAAQQGDNKEIVKALTATCSLGLLFTLFQVYEYSHAHFGLKDGIYGATFFMATGFHGLHVIIGNIFLFVCLLRARKNHFTADRHFGLEAAAWYWHFVDVVWIFLFVSIY